MKKVLSKPCKVFLALCFLLSIYSNSAIFAQATDASVAGKVTDENGDALPGANVLIRNESTGFQAGTITNANGDFTFKQLPLGKPYTITASFVGYGEQKRTGYALNQGDRIVVNFKLTQASTELNEIVVTGDQLKEVEQLGAATSVSAAQIKNLPLEGRNFTGLTSLSPLQGAGGINLGGQRRTSTNITIDGANARNQLLAGESGSGPYTISLEAIREFEVVTNSYDVTQGRQAGGAINAITKSGTNTLSGSAFVYHRNDKLSNQNDIRGNRRTQDFYNTQWGFSLGGPIIRDKLHFFVALDRQDAGSPVFIADINNEADESRLGIRRDTLNKAIDIARRLYGVSNSPQVGQFDRKTVANTVFARIDWQLNNKHRITFRNNYSDWNEPLNGGDNSNINLRESWNDFSSRENSFLVSLRSSVSPQLTNELKVQYQTIKRLIAPSSELPGSNIPRAIVNIVSPIPTTANPNATQSRTFQFGGQRFTPESTLDRQVHIINTSYLSAGRFNFTFGTDNMITYLETLLSNEQNGRFFFNSLQDLENFRPSRYAREVPLQGLPLVKQTVLDLSLFAQAEFKPTADITTEFGIRYDATAFLNAADYNPVVEQELGIRTDHKPADWNNIQPRLQLTWNMGGKDTDILKIGGGIFAAQPHYYAQVNNIQNSGTMLGAIDVSGNLVPTPDFIAYRRDPSTVPGIPEGAGIISTINSVSKDFQVPSTLKGNISYTHLFNERLSAGINAIVSRTYNNYVYLERNLVDEPYFRIAAEENRGVFVPASTITSRGLTNWLFSRKSTLVGRALELNSTGTLNQMALILEATYRIGKDGYLNTSYTFNQAKDNSSYNCCVANTSTFLPVKDDPRALSYGYSDNHFGSKLVINGATPTWKGFVFGATITGTGGTRYSLKVAGNTSVNGDFVLTNDLAYVFDPNDPETPAAIADGINGVLNDPNAAESVKDYIRSNVGRIAERNGGKNPFAAVIDLRLTKSIKTFKGQALELSADMFNFANFLGKAFDDLDIMNKQWGERKLWGKNNNIDTFNGTNLLRVQGFDQATQQYTYSVEGGVGVRPINGIPWRLQLGVRYSF
jgi:hypothetical protein